MANCANWFKRISKEFLKWISVGCLLCYSIAAYLSFLIHIQFFHSIFQFVFEEEFLVEIFHVFFLLPFFWQQPKQFVYGTPSVVFLTYLCRWPGTCDGPLPPFFTYHAPSALHGQSFQRRLWRKTKADKRQKAALMKTRRRRVVKEEAGERRPGPGLKTFHNGSFSLEPPAFLLFPPFPPCFFTSSVLLLSVAQFCLKC